MLQALELKHAGGILKHEPGEPQGSPLGFACDSRVTKHRGTTFRTLALCPRFWLRKAVLRDFDSGVTAGDKVEETVEKVEKSRSSSEW